MNSMIPSLLSDVPTTPTGRLPAERLPLCEIRGFQDGATSFVFHCDFESGANALLAAHLETEFGGARLKTDRQTTSWSIQRTWNDNSRATADDVARAEAFADEVLRALEVAVDQFSAKAGIFMNRYHFDADDLDLIRSHLPAALTVNPLVKSRFGDLLRLVAQALAQVRSGHEASRDSVARLKRLKKQIDALPDGTFLICQWDIARSATIINRPGRRTKRSLQTKGPILDRVTDLTTREVHRNWCLPTPEIIGMLPKGTVSAHCRLELLRQAERLAEIAPDLIASPEVATDMAERARRVMNRMSVSQAQ